jgi:hypothetical protein
VARRIFRRKRATVGPLVKIVLAAFTLRALIPVGFMPSLEHPFTLSICPEGFPIELLPANDHAVHHAHAAGDPANVGANGSSPHDHGLYHHCSFATAAAAPRFADLPSLAIPFERGEPIGIEYPSRSLGTPHFLLAQPRAPPTFT